MLLRKITVLLVALMLLGSAAPAMAVPGHTNNGHQIDDGLDHDQGGGNDHIKHNHGKGND